MTLCNRTLIRRERVSRDACPSLLYPSRYSHTHPSRHRGLASTYGDDAERGFSIRGQLLTRLSRVNDPSADHVAAFIQRG